MHLVHIGAHRTGTTSLQHFLRSNSEILSNNSICVFAPPETRESPQWVIPKCSSVIVSEENLLGTMENNIWRKSLYPDVKHFVGKRSQVFDGASGILLSIRDIADWWRSAILFAVERELPIPSKSTLLRIAESERSWSNVVDDLKNIFPHIPIFVREFQWKPDNPKQLLRHVTANEMLNQCRLDRRPQNSAATYQRLTVSLFSRNDFDSLRRIKNDPELAFFSREQVEDMDQRYDEDLKILSQTDGVNLLIDRDTFNASRLERLYIRTVKQSDQEFIDAPQCLLHIGKTGSDIVRRVFGKETMKRSGVTLCGSGETLRTTQEKFGPNRKLFFFFRDPITRFVDGFMSRMRQGRPRYQTSWSDGEALVFSYFASPNALAEALFGDDERLDSAARYALEQLFHSKFDQEFFLTSPQAVEFEYCSGNIQVCCDYNHIEQHLLKIGERMSLSTTSVKWEQLEPLTQELSAKSISNLKCILEKEIQIYETCKRIADDLGFGG